MHLLMYFYPYISINKTMSWWILHPEKVLGNFINKININWKYIINNQNICFTNNIKVTFTNATIFKEIVAKYKEFITKSIRFHQSWM